MSRLIYIACMLLLLTSCTGIPDGITAVDGFEVKRYVGKWYEIARLDHSFERGLDNISATYTLRDDGGITVLNQGRNIEDFNWQQAEGVGYFVDKPTLGRLEVSFFRPFYGAYNIIALDKAAYQYVMITGPNRDYLWILARTPKLDKDILQKLLAQAKAQGFATDQLIYAQHTAP